ncbi:MAG: pentapeptide repeat-containing protein [Planctomycetota bacterium]
MSLLDLFRPKWKRSDPAVRKAAVAEIDDVAILVKVAVDDLDEDVRLAAVARIDDPAALAEVFRNSFTEGVRAAALDGITDPELLATAAKSLYDRVRLKAAGKLTDQAVLADLAGNDKCAAVREAALARVTDEQLRREVRKREPHAVVRELAEKANDRLEQARIQALADATVSQVTGIQLPQRAGVNPMKLVRSTRKAWDAWRQDYPHRIDLSGAELEGLPLFGFDFSGVNLSQACFREAVVYDCVADEATDLSGATFEGANVVEAGQAFLDRMSDAQKQQAGLMKSGTAKCDICRTPVADGEGYVLTTRQVVTTADYWAIALEAIRESPDQFQPYLQRQCRQTTGWLTCGPCIETFPEADRSLAREHAEAYWEKGGDGSYAPPGGEAVDPADALPAASAAWETLTGSAAPEADIEP